MYYIKKKLTILNKHFSWFNLNVGLNPQWTFWGFSASQKLF